jgi:hypothetical protein
MTLLAMSVSISTVALESLVSAPVSESSLLLYELLAVELDPDPLEVVLVGVEVATVAPPPPPPPPPHPASATKIDKKVTVRCDFTII